MKIKDLLSNLLSSVMLLFLSTVLILFIGVNFGYSQLDAPEPVSARISALSEPFSDVIDVEFLENMLPAYE